MQLIVIIFEWSHTVKHYCGVEYLNTAGDMPYFPVIRALSFNNYYKCFILLEHRVDHEQITIQTIITTHKKKYHGTLPMYHGT